MTRPDEDQRGATTRRGLFGGAVLGGALLGAAAARSAPAAPAMATRPSNPQTQALTSLRQEIALPAPPAQVYAALMSSKDFAAFTRMPATIDPRPGGAIRLFGPLVDGRNVELAPGKRIVQAWRPIGEWPPGVYSLVKFELAPAAGGGTALTLDHTGFPPGNYDHLYAGWGERYWTPLRAYLASGRK